VSSFGMFVISQVWHNSNIVRNRVLNGVAPVKMDTFLTIASVAAVQVECEAIKWKEGVATRTMEEVEKAYTIAKRKGSSEAEATAKAQQRRVECEQVGRDLAVRLPEGPPGGCFQLRPIFCQRS
jgi:hypothetical protein